MAPTSPTTPPPGCRLLPVTIDEIEKDDPDRVWASIPVSSKLADGYRDFTFRVLANAINRAAWLLENMLGWSTRSRPVAYIGKSDMRYHILSMAAAKAGYQILFSSHVNSLSAHLNLLELCDCGAFLSAKGVDVSDILHARPAMQHGLCPELDELLDSAPVKAYPMGKTFEDAADDTFLILHSSGTTGLPKPIRITHAQIAANDSLCQLPQECNCGGPGFRRISPIAECAGRLIVPFAPFHVISAVILMCLTVFGKSTYVFGPADRSMTASDLLDAIEYGNGDCTFCSPALLEKYASSRDDMTRLGKLSTICYGGGVLSPRAAKTLIENLTRTKFVQFFGATESGLWALYHLDMDPEYREYLSIDACHMGLEWRPVDGGSELLSAVANGDPEAQTPHSTFYEPIFVRRKDPALASRQAIFQTFPDIDEYATGDLFTPHPIRPNTWKFAGRADDLILFGHGIKFHPAGIEAKIQRTHNEIQEVVMWGDGHQQAILLIELTDEGLAGMEDGRGESKVRSRLDILIDEVNVEAPVIAQIAKTHIIIATRGKSLPRTAKGSVRRREAAKLYRVEIDEVYRVYGDEMVRMMSRVQ